MSVLTVALAFGGFLPLAARAAKISGFSDTMSTLSAGAPADHAILFVTPSGVDAPSDTITATLGTSGTFNLSAITAGDVDFGVDNAAPFNDCIGPFGEKTLAASASLGVWGVAVSGQTLTLTPPTNALIGEVISNRCVRLLIGTNASSQTAGVNRIINPAAGQYALTIAGGFGDTGYFTFSILSSSDVTVTATVGPVDSGGGGTLAPVITNVHVMNVTETTADVLWDTSVASTSTVDYGTTAAYGGTATTAGTDFNHVVHLTGLTASTLYHFRVRSTGVGTPEAVSSDYTFTTIDTTAPVISNIQATQITGTSARITWDTNENANSTVEYGTSASYGSTSTNGTMTNAHTIDLTGLTPNTVYHFRVTSTDPSNNSATSIDLTFMTRDTVAPVISNILVDNITQTTARVNWMTDELADSRVYYGTTPAYGSNAYNGGLVSNHQVPLAGLAPGTLYHFIVVSKDAAGNSATSTDQTFTTTSDTTPPANVSNLVVTPGNAKNTLTWTNPSDSDFAGVVIRRSITGYPSTPTQGTGVYNGAGTTLVDTGLTNGVTYYYTVFAYDSSGNYASGTLGNGTPFDSTPPGPVINLTATAGNAHIALSWTNPSDADFSNVILRRSTTGFPASPTSGTAVYSGAGQSFDDTGLTNGTTYYYSIWARDTSNNFSTPAQATAMPTAAAPFCGDGSCNGNENHGQCPADCPVPPPANACGNGICENNENHGNCSADCPAGPPANACGNTICDPGETTNNCPADCPAKPKPKPPVNEPPQSNQQSPVELSDIFFLVQNRTIRLVPDQSGAYEVLVTRTFSPLIPEEVFKKPVQSIVLNFGDGSYLFRKGESASNPIGYWERDGFNLVSAAHAAEIAAGAKFWGVDVQVPPNPGPVKSAIIVAYADGTNDILNFVVSAQPFGLVYETVGSSKMPVSGATVTLYRKTAGNWEVWNAAPFYQSNPLVTGSSGVYGYMVPTGDYYLEVKAEGYRTKTTAPFTAPYNIIDRDIELIKIPVGAGLIEQTTYITKIVTQEIIQNPDVEHTASNVIAPAAAAITVAIIASTVQATGLLAYFLLLLTQPLLLFGAVRRKEYGVVYNSLSKVPIDLAIVRLFRATGKLVRTSATDKSGRYAFLVDEGQYRIEATKPGMRFPSEILKGRTEDNKYVDLYHGEMVTVDKDGALLTPNIPLDPLEKTESARKIVLDSFLRKLQNGLAVASIIYAVVLYAIYHKWYLAALAIVQIILYFAFRRIARPKQPKNWGIIYDEETKKPVPFAVARIVESAYNKVLESHVTDAKGRYNFLVGNNKYFVTIEKPGYTPKKTREIDLSVEKTGEGVLAMDIGITPSKAEPPPPSKQEPPKPETPSTPSP